MCNAGGGVKAAGEKREEEEEEEKKSEGQTETKNEEGAILEGNVMYRYLCNPLIKANNDKNRVLCGEN